MVTFVTFFSLFLACCGSICEKLEFLYLLACLGCLTLSMEKSFTLLAVVIKTDQGLQRLRQMNLGTDCFLQNLSSLQS